MRCTVQPSKGFPSMKKTALAIGAAAAICLAGVGAPAAVAVTHSPHVASAPSKAKFKATVKPAKPRAGQTIIAHATGAQKNAKYYCLLALYHKGITGNANSAVTGSLITVKAGAAGKITCKNIFLPFKRSWKGKKHSCPPTKADKKAGWGCGLAFASVKGHNFAGTAVFKF
jgi:hypothetical protein